LINLKSNNPSDYQKALQTRYQYIKNKCPFITKDELEDSVLDQELRKLQQSLGEKEEKVDLKQQPTMIFTPSNSSPTLTSTSSENKQKKKSPSPSRTRKNDNDKE
jgi:hypothetical protein